MVSEGGIGKRRWGRWRKIGEGRGGGRGERRKRERGGGRAKGRKGKKKEREEGRRRRRRKRKREENALLLSKSYELNTRLSTRNLVTRNKIFENMNRIIKKSYY